MKLILSLLAFVPLMVCAEPQKIFDGKTLDGWVVKGASYWKVADGMLIGESNEAKKSSDLWTAKDYQDFALDLEFRYSGHIDSGVFVRQPKDQIQIGISGSLKRDMTASPYIASKRGYPAEAIGVKALLKEGEWNKMRIVAKGGSYKVALNGKDVLDYNSDTFVKKGPIGLQVHPGLRMKIEFRNLQIEELK